VIRTIGSLILDALDEINSYGWKHLDLTPSNIMVTSRRGMPMTLEAVDSIVLIDVGRNHLYSRSLSLLEGPEAIFVAPEVKSEKQDYQNSDLFSFALILIWLANRGVLVAPLVSDNIFQQAAPLGRFLEDLVDEDPAKRFLLINVDPASDDLNMQLKEALVDGLHLLESAQQVAPADERWLKSLADLYRSRHPQQQWRLWRDSRKRPNKLATQSGWLLAWSVVCAANWYMISIVVFVWALRYWGVDNFPASVDILKKLLGQEKGLPFIDSLMASEYKLGLSAINIQALLLALSFGLVSTKYYQSIYAGLTARPISGIATFMSEFLMRFNTFWVGGPILAAILINPRWWPWCAATGYIIVAANDLFSNSLASRFVNKASLKFSSVPGHMRQSVRAHGEWWRIMALYAAILFFLAYALADGLVFDWWVYACLIIMVNIGKLYTSNASRLAPAVRGTLARAFVLGEKIEALRRREKLAEASTKFVIEPPTRSSMRC
jgi:serine/threonine protein kinase